MHMNRLAVLIIIPLLMGLTACNKKDATSPSPHSSFAEKAVVEEVINELQNKFPEIDISLISRGVNQLAALWTYEDGSEQEFKDFCINYYYGDKNERQLVFNKISEYLEILYGHFNKISLELKQNLHLDRGEIHEIDLLFGGYSASAHLQDDLFGNKIAFISILNFPFYTLSEKNESGKIWDELEWAYARLGDYFSSRVPAAIRQNVSLSMTAADNYISSYNIYVGFLVNDDGERLFPENLKLISHWGLRDELKSQYAEKKGVENQKMIYAVMKRIIDQSIPQDVINSNQYLWNPFTNKFFDNGKEVSFEAEDNSRYEVLLRNFRAYKEMDPYTPNYPNQIMRSFDGNMEFSQKEIEELFVEFISSPVIRDAGKLVKLRLGRDLEPFDIWYDGFKSRSSISEDLLNSQTKKKYPDVASLQRDLSNLLIRLGWDRLRADYLASLIVVDPSRGAGHAWGAAMRSDVAHLRTRVGSDGMDYKGYNIAMHEFGHNVEQTISLYEVEHYTMNGVPNTAFTEALAFMFQSRDLDMLGIEINEPMAQHLKALDILWGSYEIMGVALLDMRVWNWMYENPDANASELKDAVIDLATDIWNNYYADVFGSKDEPILAIYSHMIKTPLYLANYPLGRLIEFQLEQHIQGKPFADEVHRIFSLGRLTPQIWMNKATGMPVSNEPTLNAASKAIKVISK